MKKFRISLLVFTLLLISLSSKSQSNEKINLFLKKVEKTLKTYDSTAIIQKFRISSTKRKTYIVGTMDSGKKIFRKTIKHYRSGLKKETLQVMIYTPFKKYIILNILKINDKYSYIEFNERGKNKSFDIIYNTKETLIDKSYKKVYFDEIGKELKTEQEVNTNK